MLVSARDASVLDSEGAGIPASEFLKLIEQAEEGSASAAARWAVVLGDNERLCLQLQGLPAAAATARRLIF